MIDTTRSDAAGDLRLTLIRSVEYGLIAHVAKHDLHSRALTNRRIWEQALFCVFGTNAQQEQRPDGRPQDRWRHLWNRLSLSLSLRRILRGPVPAVLKNPPPRAIAAHQFESNGKMSRLAAYLDNLARFGRTPSIFCALRAFVFPLCGTLAMSPQPSLGQTSNTPLASFFETSQDENNVDLISGYTSFSLSDVSIGSGSSALSHSISSVPNGFPIDVWGFSDNFMGGMRQANTSEIGPLCYPAKIVEVGGSSNFFCGDDAAGYSEYRHNGALLTKIDSATYRYTDRDGVVFTLSAGDTVHGWFVGFHPWRLSRIQRPDGQDLNIYFDTSFRIRSVTHNAGYQLRYEYGIATNSNLPTKVTAINTAIDYCNPTATTCSYSRTWPNAQYDWYTSATENRLTVTDSNGLTTRYTMDKWKRVIKVKPAAATVDTIEYFYCQHNNANEPLTCSNDPDSGAVVVGQWAGQANIYDKTYQVTRNGKNWNYVFGVAPIQSSLSVQSFLMTSDVGRSKSVLTRFYTDGTTAIEKIVNDNKTYIFTTDRDNRLLTVTRTDDFDIDQTGYFDARGNLTGSRKHKSGSGLADVFTYSGYDATCTNINKCNKPNWVKDGKGNQTDYVYETTGLLKKVTLPADPAGIRPQTRYFYTQKYAWVKNASGAYAQAASPIWLLTSESTCKTGAASGNGCALANDEVLTAYDYGPASGPNNLFLRGKAVTSGGVTLRTCYSYDVYSNTISETAPRAGLASCP